MAKITYKVGDVTNPHIKTNVNVIIQINNNVGMYETTGISGSISKKWKNVEQLYRQWFNQKAFLKGEEAFELGNIQVIPLDHVGFNPKTYVINMIAQDGIMSDTRNNIPLVYIALKNCLKKVYQFCSSERSKGIPISINLPRIGTDLVGNKWDEIEKLIKECLSDGKSGFPCYVYDLPQEVANNKWEGTVYE